MYIFDLKLQCYEHLHTKGKSQVTFILYINLN